MNWERFERELQAQRENADSQAQYYRGLGTGIDFAINALETEKTAKELYVDAEQRLQEEEERLRQALLQTRTWGKGLLGPAPSVVKKCAELVPVYAQWEHEHRAGCYTCPAPIEKDTPYILHRGRMYCLACSATRQYLRGEN